MKRLELLLAVTFVCVSLSLPAAGADEANQGKLFWIFLTTGKSTEGVARDDVMAMQQAHLANFGKLAGEGKLLGAGPMQDPDRVLRGIVLMKATDTEKLAAMFEADPYVQKGFLKVEPHEVKITHGGFANKITPTEMAEYRIVVFEHESTSQANAVISERQGEHAGELFANKQLLLAAEFAGESKRRYVWIAKANSGLQKAAEQAPAVAQAGLACKTMPIYLGKGSLLADSSAD